MTEELDPRSLVVFLRDHVHPHVCDTLERHFDLGTPVPGSYLHQWNLDPGLRDAEESLIAAGQLPAIGPRMIGKRHRR